MIVSVIIVLKLLNFFLKNVRNKVAGIQNRLAIYSFDDSVAFLQWSFDLDSNYFAMNGKFFVFDIVTGKNYDSLLYRM